MGVSRENIFLSCLAAILLVLMVDWSMAPNDSTGGAASMKQFALAPNTVDTRCINHAGQIGSRTVICKDANGQTVPRILCTGPEPDNVPVVCPAGQPNQTLGACSSTCGYGTQTVSYACDPLFPLSCMSLPPSTTQGCTGSSTCTLGLSDYTWTMNANGAVVSTPPLNPVAPTAPPGSQITMVPQVFPNPSNMGVDGLFPSGTVLLGPGQTAQSCIDQCKASSNCNSVATPLAIKPNALNLCYYYTSKAQASLAPGPIPMPYAFTHKVLV